MTEFTELTPEQKDYKERILQLYAEGKRYTARIEKDNWKLERIQQRLQYVVEHSAVECGIEFTLECLRLAKSYTT